MSKTIVFKPEIEAKLKKLRIKQKFVKNWIANKWSDSEFPKDELREIAESAETWRSFINYSFEWCSTTEGFKYWCDISKL